MGALSQLYTAFHTAIRTGDSAHAAQNLSPHPRLSSAEQLAIYSDGYRIRLLAVLRDACVASVAYRSDAAFDALAQRYIAAVAPRSYSIDHYPAGLAEYAQEDAGFAHDLLKLECAIHKVYWSVSDAEISVRSFNNVGEDALAGMVLPLSPAAMVLALDYPVDAWFGEFRAGHLPPAPAPQKNHLLIVRHGKAVQRHPLSATAYALLSRLQAGDTVGAAIEAVCAQGDANAVAQELQSWFAQWVALGIFVQPEENILPQ